VVILIKSLISAHMIEINSRAFLMTETDLCSETILTMRWIDLGSKQFKAFQNNIYTGLITFI
jgi:hypothetical protein